MSLAVSDRDLPHRDTSDRDIPDRDIPGRDASGRDIPHRDTPDRLPDHQRSPMRFGANYTLGKAWFHGWLDLDLDQVRRDLDGLAALGLDHIRVLPLWDVLQPNRALVRPAAVADVVAVVDAAHAAGLDASVDALQGHLSSYDFVPSWLTTWHRRNLFTDPEALDGQARLVGALGEALAGRPGFLGLTLGNEVPQFAKAAHPDPRPVTPAEADAWLARLLEAARAAAPSSRHTHSYDDDVWFVDSSTFTPRHAVRHGDLLTVHSWVFTGVAHHFPADHPAQTWFARYLLELAAAWARSGAAAGSGAAVRFGDATAAPGTGQRATTRDTARPLWLQEVGAPVPVLGEERVPAFAVDTLANAVTMPGLWGVTWWCSHDVDRSLADFPELEYSLGLLTSDGVPKPLGKAVRDALPGLREAAARMPDARAASALAAPCDADGRVLRSRTAPGSEFFAAWVEAAEAGGPPRIELPGGATAVVQEDGR